MIWLASLCPIGSVVQVGARRLVVVGHRFVPDGDTVGVGYLLVPYPLGFVGTESLSVVPASRVTEVASEGLANEDGAAYLEELGELAQASTGIAQEEFEQATALLGALAAEKGASDAE